MGLGGREGPGLGLGDLGSPAVPSGGQLACSEPPRLLQEVGRWVLSLCRWQQGAAWTGEAWA